MSGWPIDRADLDRFVPEIERLFRLDQSSYEELPASMLNDSLAGGRVHMTPRWSKWPTFRRRNLTHLLRDMVAIQRNPEIWLNATACDLAFDVAAGRLTAVKAKSTNGRRLTVMADWFIVAAGTLETTRLLLQLDELTGGRAFSGCDALGRYFTDHLKLEAGRIQPLDGMRTNLAFGYHIRGSTRRGLHLETTASAQREDQAASGYVTIRTGSISHSRSAQLSSSGRTRSPIASWTDGGHELSATVRRTPERRARARAESYAQASDRALAGATDPRFLERPSRRAFRPSGRGGSGSTLCANGSDCAVVRFRARGRSRPSAKAAEHADEVAPQHVGYGLVAGHAA